MLDYVKTGNFIAGKRKERGLTQKQLVEQLAISDKTVSKWETGRSAPDNSIMLELCQILGISVNELLSGEEISEDIYVRRAEENFVELIKEEERRGADERFTRAGMVLEFLLLLVTIYITLFGFTNGYRYVTWFLDWCSFGFVVGVTLLVLLIAGMMSDFVRAFLISFGRRGKCSAEEKKRALIAVQTALFAFPLSGILAFVTGFILVTARQINMSELLPNIGAAMLTFFYGVLFDLSLLPVAARLKRESP